MMVGRDVNFTVDKEPSHPKDIVLSVRNLSVKSKSSELHSVKNVSFDVRQGEIVCIAGIEGNGQSELIYAITGLEKPSHGDVFLNGENIATKTIRDRSKMGMSHIPEDRHKHGLVLDYSLEKNFILQKYWQEQFQKKGFLKFDEIRNYALKTD